MALVCSANCRVILDRISTYFGLSLRIFIVAIYIYAIAALHPLSRFPDMINNDGSISYISLWIMR